MAKVEFYKIIVRDKKEGNIIKNNIAEIIKNKVDVSSTKDKYCMKSTCSAILAEYKENTTLCSIHTNHPFQTPHPPS